jgi:arginine-tRNA-protein transferase
LPDAVASLESLVMVDVSAEEWELLLSRGWRRFGPVYFRPRCPGCRECVPIRVPVATFTPSRSQKRAWKACADVRAEVSVPTVDAARLALYAKWHSMREATREWPAARLDEESYAMEFAHPHPAAREVTFWLGERLVGVALCDQTPSAWSAIYFFYDPDERHRSLGTFDVLWQIEHAKRLGIPHVYLGFRVMGCPSMRYKSAFRPHELLVSRPDEPPAWEVAESEPEALTPGPSPPRGEGS